VRAALRLPLAVALAALLGGCVVDVDGAPCTVPGQSPDCPSGQACGNDHRCSARAAACVSSGSRCAPGTGGACLDPTGATTGVDRARRCVGDDPVCGRWIVEACTDAGLTCELRTDVGARCVCTTTPTPTRDLAVRPDGSPGDAPPFPTGASSPPVCAFLRLGDALGAAKQIAAADPSAAVTVTAGGVAAGATRTFSTATGETFPLPIMDRVSLRSEPGGGSYEIVFDAENGPTAPVVLHSGGALAGFAVRNGKADASHDALQLSCDGSTTPARLASVTLDGKGAGGIRLGHGVVAGSTCGIVAQDVTVRDMSVAALVIDSAAGLPSVAFTGGSITGCGDGIVVTNGRLLLDGARVAGNAGMGVRADAFGGSPRVELRRSKIVGNGDTGIALVNAPEVRIVGTTVYANGAVTSWGGLPFPLSNVSRRSGGIVLWGEPPASGSLDVTRNRVYANEGDQFLVIGTKNVWTLDGACGADADGPLFNSLGCYDPTPAGTTVTYRGLVAIDAVAVAKYVAWGAVTPSGNEVGGDYRGYGPWGSVSLPLLGTPPTPAFCVDATLVCSSENPGP
jgi:hypothetical protein